MNIKIDFSVSDSAASELAKVLEDGSVIRISAKSSGCSGSVYGLGIGTMEDVGALDILEELGGIKFVVDRSSAMLLDGVVLDWHSSQDGQGFKFTNKNPQGGCCRKSGGCS